jgi:hypothetical protein
MKEKANGSSTAGQAANFSEDFEREALKDSVYLLEEQQRIMQEINEDEHRLPAKVTVIYETKPQPHDELKDNALPF